MRDILVKLAVPAVVFCAKMAIAALVATFTMLLCRIMSELYQVILDGTKVDRSTRSKKATKKSKARLREEGLSSIHHLHARAHVLTFLLYLVVEIIGNVKLIVEGAYPNIWQFLNS